MYKITINNERYLRYCTSEYFDEGSNVSKNLTLKEVSNFIRQCRFIKNGQILYNNGETEIIGGIKESHLVLSTSTPMVKHSIKTYEERNHSPTRRQSVNNLATLHEVERLQIIKVNEYTSNKTQASEILGISLKTLYNKLAEHSIVWNTNNWQD